MQSMSHLRLSPSLEEIATRLISTNNQQSLLSNTDGAHSNTITNSNSNNNTNQGPKYACIAIAGGGGHAISTLASTPGASSLFLEGTITYDRNSFHAYVGECMENQQHNHDNNNDNTNNDNITRKPFQYASEKAAKMLSRAAVRRALQYRANLDEYPRCLGVGIASALRSQKQHGRGGYGFVVATLADGTEWKCEVHLEPNKRSRMEEDQLIGRLALQSIEQLNTEGRVRIMLDENDDEGTEMSKETIEEGDVPASPSAKNQNNRADTIEESFTPVHSDDPVREAAERILNQECKAVLLLPVEGHNKFKALTDPVLPMESLVFPGSFNPPHDGHTTLAQAALAAWKGSSKAVFLELSLINPDKPSMDPLDVSERAHRFFQLQDRLPAQWGILLTSAPLFAQKVGVLRPFMAPVHSDRPQLGFVIGTDTMVRIVNPKYYDNDQENMLEAIREMGRSGVHFVVGGRLEQRKMDKVESESATKKSSHNSTTGNDRFVTGQEEVEALPKDVQKMFTLVTEENFRVDISSTEIRKRMAAEAKSSNGNNKSENDNDNVNDNANKRQKTATSPTTTTSHNNL